MHNTISSSKRTSRSSRSSSKKSLLLKLHHENKKENPKKHVDEFRVSIPNVNSKRKLRIRHKLNELLARPLRQGATQHEKEIRKIKIEKYEQLLQLYSPVKLKLKGGSSSKKYKKYSNKNKTSRFRR
jgi:hypothetical protein